MEKYNTELSPESIANNTNMRPLDFLLIISCSAPLSFLCHQILPAAVIQRQLCLKKATAKMGLILARAWCPKNHVIISKTKWQQTKKKKYDLSHLFSKGTPCYHGHGSLLSETRIFPLSSKGPDVHFSERQSSGSKRTNNLKKTSSF